jgi:hypothetical protein
MRKNANKVKAVLAVAVFSVGLLVDAKLAQGDFDQLLLSGTFTSPAGAIVGRPLTPVSVAGVARRTTRRTVRRTAIYIAALPPNCATLALNGIPSWNCGGTYYQQSGTQYVVINIDND